MKHALIFAFFFAFFFTATAAFAQKPPVISSPVAPKDPCEVVAKPGINKAAAPVRPQQPATVTPKPVLNGPRKKELPRA